MKKLQQAAFDFVAAAWAHQYLPGAGSTIRAHIIAAGWVHQYLPGDGSIVCTQQSTENTYNIYITNSTFLANENKDAAASSVCFEFVVAAWAQVVNKAKVGIKS